MSVRANDEEYQDGRWVDPSALPPPCVSLPVFQSVLSIQWPNTQPKDSDLKTLDMSRKVKDGDGNCRLQCPFSATREHTVTMPQITVIVVTMVTPLLSADLLKTGHG